MAKHIVSAQFLRLTLVNSPTLGLNFCLQRIGVHLEHWLFEMGLLLLEQCMCLLYQMVIGDDERLVVC